MTMQKLFHFDCPQEVYRADAVIISCFDARFDLAMRKFLKRRGVVTFDHVKIPGSAKSLAAPECDSDRDFVLRMVRTSLRLHAPDRLLMLAHNDCGAYPAVPLEVVTADLLRAAEVLRAAEPSLPVECFFADFDGIYRVEEEQTSLTVAAPGSVSLRA
jgi:hypothetical protein